MATKFLQISTQLEPEQLGLSGYFTLNETSKLVRMVQKQWDNFLSNPLPMCDFADDLKSEVIENVLSEREFE